MGRGTVEHTGELGDDGILGGEGGEEVLWSGFGWVGQGINPGCEVGTLSGEGRVSRRGKLLPLAGLQFEGAESPAIPFPRGLVCDGVQRGGGAEVGFVRDGFGKERAEVERFALGGERFPDRGPTAGRLPVAEADKENGKRDEADKGPDRGAHGTFGPEAVEQGFHGRASCWSSSER